MEKSSDYHNLTDYVEKQTGFATPEEWFKHLVKQAKEDTKHSRQQWRTNQANLEEDRTDREMQGGSRRKGGRVGWPLTKKTK